VKIRSLRIACSFARAIAFYGDEKVSTCLHHPSAGIIIGRPDMSRVIRSQTSRAHLQDTGISFNQRHDLPQHLPRTALFWYNFLHGNGLSGLWGGHTTRGLGFTRNSGHVVQGLEQKAETWGIPICLMTMKSSFAPRSVKLDGTRRHASEGMICSCG